jgi:RimJ/RimL family protein N-acetyltransferase
MRTLNKENYFWKDDLVELRSMVDSDWEGYYYNRYDTEGRRRVNCVVELPPTEQEAEGFVEKFKGVNTDHGRIMLTVVNQEGTNVGAINLNSIDERNGTFSIGLQIDRDHRSKGYGTAAMRILMRYAFLERRLNKYYGHVLEGNIPSATMLKKVGCVEEGRRSQMYYISGKYHDAVLFGLTKEEFIKANA